MSDAMPISKAAHGALLLLLLPALPVVSAQEFDVLTQPYPSWLCESCAEWSVSREPFRIHANSYYVGTEGLSAILITSPEGHVLIDGALPESAPLILENIRALENGFRRLESLSCDILITTHPVSSSMWDRLENGPRGLVDAQACKAYAERSRRQLSRRLSREQEGQNE